MAATFSTEQQDPQGRSAAFVDAATGVLLLDPGGLDVDGLKTSIGLCGTLRGIVSAAEAGFVGELERRAGRHEATEALRKKQKVSPAKAKRRSKTSKTTSEQPDLAAALADGSISEEHADAIADADQAHPDAGATAALLDQARGQSVEQFRHTAKGWERGQQADEGEAEAERQYKARKVRSRIRPEDGMGVTIAELDPENHATFMTALAWWVRKLKNNRNKKVSDSGSENGLGKTSAGSGSKDDPAADRALIACTGEQLLADALVAMASASTNPGSVGSAVATARMLVIAKYDAVTRSLTGRLPGGTVLSPETVRRLACDAEILPAVFGSDSQLLDLGMSARTASVGQRVALAERDGGCRGCGAGVEFCVAHHIIHWAALGPTDLDNLMLLCSRCHHLVHEGSYTVHKRPDGKYIIVAPKQSDRRPHIGHPTRNPANHTTGNGTNTTNTTNSGSRGPISTGTGQSKGTPHASGAPGASGDPDPGTSSTPGAGATSHRARSPGTGAASHPARSPGTGRPGHPSTAPGANTTPAGRALPDPDPSTRGTGHPTRGPGTSGTSHPARAPGADGTGHPTRSPDTGRTGHSNTSPGDPEPNRSPSPGAHTPNVPASADSAPEARLDDVGHTRSGSPGPHGRHTTGSNKSTETHRGAFDRQKSSDIPPQPSGPTGRRQSMSISQCIVETQDATAITDPRLDLFNYLP